MAAPPDNSQTSRWAEIDDRPASNGKTFTTAAIAADTDLTAQVGYPPSPTSAILIQGGAAGGNVILTMLGGGNITVAIGIGQSLYLRIAVVTIVDTGTTADGTITVFWNASHKKFRAIDP